MSLTGCVSRRAGVPQRQCGVAPPTRHTQGLWCTPPHEGSAGRVGGPTNVMLQLLDSTYRQAGILQCKLTASCAPTTMILCMCISYAFGSRCRPQTRRYQLLLTPMDAHLVAQRCSSTCLGYRVCLGFASHTYNCAAATLGADCHPRHSYGPHQWVCILLLNSAPSLCLGLRVCG